MTADQTPQQASRSPRLYSAGSSGIRVSVAVGLARSLLGAGAVLLLGSVVDSALAGRNPGFQLTWLAALLAGRAILAAIPPRLASSISSSVETDLRARLLDAVLHGGPWSGKRTGDTVTKATEGVEAVGALAGLFLPQLIAGMSIPIVLAVVVAAIDWVVAVVLVMVLPAVPLLLRLLEKRFASVSRRYRETEDQLAARFLDGIQGLRTLKNLDRADDYGDGIAADADRLRRETMALLRVNQLALLAVDTLFTLGTVVAAAGMAALRLSSGAISPGQAVAIVLLGVMLIEPLGQIGRYFYVGALGRASARQIGGLLESDDVPGAQAEPEAVAIGAISMRGVDFTYPDGTEALHDVTFQVEPGEKVALVGRSGAGKSTIAHLVLGLLRAQAGQIAVGGRPVLVPQRPYLFHGTVAENLKVARPDATEADMWAALETAQLAETLRARPHGLATQVGERGSRLSGGEAQRLAIARAVLVDSAIVVLDEPTSNVDLESEAKLRIALDRLTATRTLLVIAHRRSTVSRMDRVLLVEEGQVQPSAPGDAPGSFDAFQRDPAK